MKILKNFTIKTLILNCIICCYLIKPQIKYAQNLEKSKYIAAPAKKNRVFYRKSSTSSCFKNPTSKKILSSAPSYSSYHIINADKVSLLEHLTPQKTNPLQEEDSDPRDAITNAMVAMNTPFGQLDWEKIASLIYKQNDKYYLNYRRLKLELTLRAEIQ
ncbi:MAG: hypothetical protein K2X39_07060, partial [Silvanigrellaceae bacterium]|nr:hypothetical protein [Silvanigrellaceae bacterium]